MANNINKQINSATNAKLYAAAAAPNEATISADFPDGGYPNGIETLASGDVTLTLPDGSSLALTGLPAFWFRPIQFKAITTNTVAVLAYRSK